MTEARRDWSRFEVEAVVADYFEMLGRELRGEPYNKSEHRRQLQKQLDQRSEGAIEYKHQNISAVLIELGQPYIRGYKPQRNYQELLFEVIEDRLRHASELLRDVEQEVDREADVPSVDDLLKRLVDPPPRDERESRSYARERFHRSDVAPNYLLREARNASLGRAGELFVVSFERARLVHEGKDSLAANVEHVAATRGDHEGFDVLSFEGNGRERLIEVKTTAFGQMTPFFLSRNQVSFSDDAKEKFHLYRLFEFRQDPRLYSLPGPIRSNFDLEASEFVARLT